MSKSPTRPQAAHQVDRVRKAVRMRHVASPARPADRRAARRCGARRRPSSARAMSRISPRGAPDAGQVRRGGQRRLAQDARHDVVGALARRAVRAVGDRDEARRERREPLDRRPQRLLHRRVVRRKELEGHRDGPPATAGSRTRRHASHSSRMSLRLCRIRCTQAAASSARIPPSRPAGAARRCRPAACASTAGHRARASRAAAPADCRPSRGPRARRSPRPATRRPPGRSTRAASAQQPLGARLAAERTIEHHHVEAARWLRCATAGRRTAARSA